ncbi:MAG: hypothetical protein ACK47B_11005 [Armatimonadota bacterium]
MSREFVRDQLKAPATASFADYEEGQVTSSDGVTFFVRSQVDAQNSFGAKLRHNYVCRLKRRGSYDFQLIDLDIQER